MDESNLKDIQEIFKANNIDFEIVRIKKHHNHTVNKTSTKENTNMYITLPKTLVEQLIHYYHTTNGLYATDLEIEAKKMTHNTFWHLKDENLQKTVEKIEEIMNNDVSII